MILDTSLDAFVAIKPELGSRQKAVLDALTYLNSATNTEISKFMGLPINQITPRINELRKKRLVGDLGKRECNVTGKVVHSWGVLL